MRTVLYYGGPRDRFAATPTGVSERLAHVLRRLGARLRRLREVAELTQETAADRAGIDVKRWQRLEAGEVNPTVRTLDRAAHALGTDFWTVVRPDDGESGEGGDRSERGTTKGRARSEAAIPVPKTARRAKSRR